MSQKDLETMMIQKANEAVFERWLSLINAIYRDCGDFIREVNIQHLRPYEAVLLFDEFLTTKLMELQELQTRVDEARNTLVNNTRAKERKAE